jgi:signal transduction histidine kinase/DNA-binding response OmpR family regulator
MISFVRTFGGLLGAIGLCACLAGSGWAQPADAGGRTLGHPVVRTFSPQAYDGNEQVWDVAQDGRGLVYLASSYGLQQYDGARWRALPTANETTPWAIARDTAGTLFVGARNELGRYRPDSLGQLAYRSLLGHVPAPHRPVGNVRAVVAADGAVYFGAATGVLRWAGGDMTALTDTTAWALHACRGTAYVRPREGRLHRASDSTLVPIASAQFLDGAVLADVLPAPAGGCQLVTAEQGRYARTDTGWTRRPWPGGPMNGAVIQAVRGPGGALAVATETTLRLVGPAGRVQKITASGPLPNGGIRALHVSERGALWVATDAGPARVAWPDPVSVVDGAAALRSGIRAIVRHDGRLTVATDQGVWRRRSNGGRIIASEGGSDLLSTAAGLLIAGNDGLHVWRNGRLRTIDDELAYALHRSPQDSSVVFVSRYDQGLSRLRRTEGRWRVAGRTDRFATPLYTMAQDTTGALWLGTGHRGVWRLGPPLTPLDDAPVARFDTTDGLPDGHFNYTLQHGKAVRFITDDGLYRRDGSTFVPDARFAPVYADRVWKGWPYVPGPDGEVWIDFGGHKVGVARPAGDSMRWTARPFRRLADVGDLSAIRPEGDSVVWFGGSDVLVRYDRRLQTHGGHAQSFHTLIRGVRTRADSLLYGGDTDARMLPIPVGPGVDGLRFQFGATSYEQIEGPTHNWDRPRQYRWRLAGVDDDWTDWTTEPRADYTSLPPGTHTMHVQARNLYRVVGREATLSFTVLPPWYRTWWAYGGYGLLALLLVGGIVQWRTRRLRRRQNELEEMVAARTEEIRQKNERLQELDDAKSRFFANLSHEFRTPLTLIRGPLQQVREHLERGTLEAVPAEADDDAEQLTIAERNAARLQRLVDQLLGLARMEAGTYDLAARPTDVGATVERLARGFEPLADRAGITLTGERDAGGGEDSETAEPEPVYVDRGALERIVSNLLSNAIKFTPEGGRVAVTVREREDVVEFSVRDTGPGIPEAEQDAVFDRFAQVDDTPTREQEGAGIGLALTRDLVDLHGGTIRLDSVEGEGTTVTIRLPRGPEHLPDDQIAAPQAPEEPTATDSPEETAPPSLDSSSSALDPRPSSPTDQASTPDPTRPTDGKWKNDSNGQSKIVLVVDDNADVRRYVRSVLTPDFSVIEASTGAAGVAAAREHRPDVILADVMMPEMDGHEMTRRLKGEPETEAIPVIMVTARAETQDEVTGLRVGADDYVTKPFDADVLRQRVGGVLTLQQRLRRRLEAELREAEDEPGAAAPEERPEIVQEARRVAREHLTDPDFDVAALADAMAMSRSTLYRKLRDASDHTPSSLLTAVRIETARTLLEEGEPVTQVAYAVGYDTLSTFSRVFREETGTPPSAYADAEA